MHVCCVIVGVRWLCCLFLLLPCDTVWLNYSAGCCCRRMLLHVCMCVKDIILYRDSVVLSRNSYRLSRTGANVDYTRMSTSTADLFYAVSFRLSNYTAWNWLLLWLLLLLFFHAALRNLLYRMLCWLKTKCEYRNYINTRFVCCDVHCRRLSKWLWPIFADCPDPYCVYLSKLSFMSFICPSVNWANMFSYRCDTCFLVERRRLCV